jgi:uncharacterized protein (TIGR02391 family)
MNEAMNVLIGIAKRLAPLHQGAVQKTNIHPFDERNIHPEIAKAAQALFDDGHYAQATFEAFKILEQKVKAAGHSDQTGFNLMMQTFNEKSPRIRLTALSSTSEIDEQLGYKHIFAGVVSAIRNPRGHDIVKDPIDTCLDHLSVASVLLRRINQAGYV